MKRTGIWFILILLIITAYFAYGNWGPLQPASQNNPPDLRVTFFDVGQGDSALIQCENQDWLIDAGSNETSQKLINNLKGLGITRLDAIIGSHPHEDHIGGLDAVIDKFEIGQVYLPQVASTTQTFEDVLSAIERKGLATIAPLAGSSFKLGRADGMWIGPKSTSYKEINDYSLILRVFLGDLSFLFMGDAGAVPENELLTSGYPLQSTTLKVGHHGSNSSTSDDFLKAVNPRYAVICAGKNNDYAHPHLETPDKLEAANIKVLRTDLNGSVTFIAEANRLEVHTQK